MAVGYVAAFFMGMVNFNSVAEAGIIQLPKLFHFPVRFEISACFAIACSLPLMRFRPSRFLGNHQRRLGRSRKPKNCRVRFWLWFLRIYIGACFGCLPTATYSQNVGIVTTTKVVNPCTLGLAAVIIPGCRAVSEVFCPSYHHSLCGSGRGNGIGICLHCHDRNETGDYRGNELSEHLHRRACRSTGHGCFPGFCSLHPSRHG